MSSDSKNYFGFLVDEISERGHTIKWNDISRHFEQFDSNRIVKHSLNEFRLKASFKSFCLRDRGRLGNEGQPILLKIGTQCRYVDLCNMPKF